VSEVIRRCFQCEKERESRHWLQLTEEQGDKLYSVAVVDRDDPDVGYRVCSWKCLQELQMRLGYEVAPEMLEPKRLKRITAFEQRTWQIWDLYKSLFLPPPQRTPQRVPVQSMPVVQKRRAG
jgi:hypothetical protein